VTSPDEQLRGFFSRVSSPAGLADRVLAAALGARLAKERRWRRTGWALSMAACALLVWGGWWTAERRRGEQAKRQALWALRLAGQQLRRAQDETQSVYRTGFPSKTRQERP